MRVALIVGPFPKLSKTFILDQITGLINRGVYIDVFASQPGNQLKVHPDFHAYELNSRIIYPYKNAYSVLDRFLKLPGLLFSHWRPDFTTIFHSLNFTRYGIKALSLAILYEVIQYSGKQEYDIIHGHFGPYGIQAQRLRELGVLKGRLVTSFHGIDLSAYLRSHGKQVYHHLFSQGDLFLPISRYWRNKLVQMGCDKNRIKVHHMGTNCHAFRLSSRKDTNRNSLQLLSVGRLEEKKGFKYSIRAVSALLKKNQNIVYQIVGDGSLRQSLLGLITNLGIQENVKLVGWKNRNEVIDILENTDIFLAPSITASDGDMEGIPMVLMEAMAMGIPVISTIHSGIPELIKDGETGLLVPERDVKALSSKLDYLITKPAIWPSLTGNARQYVEKHFNVERQNDRLLRYYHELLS